MPPSRTRSSGMDVPQDALAVTDIAPDHDAQALSRGTSGPRHRDRDTLLRHRPSTAQPLGFGDAAGPCGDGRARSRTAEGSGCRVVAPAWRPNTAGARGHTDRRAAVPRSLLRRAAARPPVCVPTGGAEARRARRRAREEAPGARQAAPCRLTAGGLRPARRATGRAPRRAAPRRWRAAGVCPRWSSTPRAEPAPNPPHASRASHRHARPRAQPGAGALGSTLSRPGAGSSARRRAPQWRPWVPSPTAIRRLTRRIDWRRLFRAIKVKTPSEDRQQWRATRAIGSHINICAQPRAFSTSAAGR
jgi:hypothetical protein